MVKLGLFTETYDSMPESLKGREVLLYKRKPCFIQQVHCQGVLAFENLMHC